MPKSNSSKFEPSPEQKEIIDSHKKKITKQVVK